MNRHEKLNYVEFPARDMEATKLFFGKVFGWGFEDYGTEYIAFSDQGLDGGFYRSELVCTLASGAPLIVFYRANLDEATKRVEALGGSISKEIFSFPGGHRFHFTDPNGNEYATWSDKHNGDNS